MPDFFNDDSLSLKQEAQRQWQSEYNAMREFLQQAAKESFKDQPAVWHKYVRSGEVLRFHVFNMLIGVNVLRCFYKHVL